MTLPLLVALAFQASAQTEAPTAYPMLPVSASPELQNLVYRIEDALASKRFDEAKKLTKFLPPKTLEVSFAPSKVPPTQMPAFELARRDAVDHFRERMKGVEVKVVPISQRLKIDFEPVLATPPNSTFPAAMTFFYSEEAKDPYLEAVIGLKRGSPQVPSTSDDFYNDIFRAMATAMGLATTPFYGGLMAGSDLPSAQRYEISSSQIFSVRAIQRLSDTLRKMVEKRISLPAGKPQLVLQTTSITSGEVFEGDDVPIAVQISNAGDAPLSYAAKGDCGCVAVHEENVLMPGQTWIIRGAIDTRDIKGPTKKNVEIMTNDPDHSAVAVPVDATIKPRYEIVSDKPNGLSADDSGAVRYHVDMKLVPGAKPIHARQSAVVGLKGTVSQSEVRDAEGKLTGYAFDVAVPNVPKGGPFVAELNILTDDPNLRVIKYPVHVINGIVALPASLYLGSALDRPREFRADILAPGLDFKILSATSNVEGIGVEVLPLKGLGYKLKVSYNGKMLPGPFEGAIAVETDSPRQRHLEIRLSGVIK